MDLTERQLGRIEACLWGIEEATRNTNQTAFRLARGIAEQLQEAETDGQAEEDLRADLRQEQAQGRIPDWRDGEGNAVRKEERGERKGGKEGVPSVFLCEQVRAYGRALMHNGAESWLGVLRGIMREIEMDQKTLGALLGIKRSSMSRILQGQQRGFLKCRMAEFFGNEPGKEEE